MTIITRLFLLLLFVTGSFQFASAQSENPQPETDSVFQISFVPGVSSSDMQSSSSISFNILGGYNGAFHGFELGSIFNGNRFDVNGFQISGVANVNERRADGALIGGAFNYSRSFSGFMLSGAFNTVRDESEGFLLAGGVNMTGEQTKGLMMSGGLNLVTHEARGVNISPLNISRRQTSGVQIGVLNIAGKQQGTQFGVINIAGEGGGESIGLLSFIGDGRFNLDFWTNETGFLNAGFRVGTEKIYNVISVGYNALYGEHLWQAGLGIGYYHRLNESIGLETDLMGYHLNHDGKWTTQTSNHIQWRLHYSHELAENVRIFTGPSLNLLMLDEELSDELIPYTIYESAYGGTRFNGWVGWTLGMGLF